MIDCTKYPVKELLSFEKEVALANKWLFKVEIVFEKGERAEFWKFADSLKSATVRTGRFWRRKKKKEL